MTANPQEALSATDDQRAEVMRQFRLEQQRYEAEVEGRALLRAHYTP